MTLIRTLMIVAACALPSLGIGAERCPASEDGCTLEDAAERIRDRVNEGAKDVLLDRNPKGRAEEVKNTVDDCLRCASEAIEDGMDKLFDR